jgi:hypothetical protein
VAELRKLRAAAKAANRAPAAKTVGPKPPSAQVGCNLQPAAVAVLHRLLVAIQRSHFGRHGVRHVTRASACAVPWLVLVQGITYDSRVGAYTLPFPGALPGPGWDLPLPMSLPISL